MDANHPAKRVKIARRNTNDGSGSFRAIWLNEVVINDIEVRPMALVSLEFDDEGEATLSFVAVKPGSYRLGVPGGGEDQSLTITNE